jgi:hypothetical protein
MKRLLLLIMVVLCVVMVCPGLAQAASSDAANVKELNFVFLHGMGGNASALQLLEDSVVAQMPAYITNYEYEHPDIKVQTDMLLRSYPNQVVSQ